ncbi:dihydrodipicolinate reductase C-terminal domain-containing protein [Plantactinospora sp. ZYX-F-223]|uniref:dihydrodipicolinate reductase C-terminal domain-containing protein n=1 Tax=Plantactinospora sp. ZYX-F-223 TaxID=3144103 RepID=UPI0031FD67BD
MRGDPLRLGVVGATGRLGSRIVAECGRRDVPVGFAATRDHWPDGADVTVVVDASRGHVLPRSAQLCRRAGAALVVCASDLTADAGAIMANLAREVPVVRAVNLSVGHWLQAHLVGIAGRVARRLPERPRASVLERHTPAKADRPSASASALAARWTASAGVPVDDVASYRAGHRVSEHRIDLTFEHEALALHHDVRGLGAAVYGAMVAARWAHDAPAGLVEIGELFDRAFLQGFDNQQGVQ